MKTFLEKLKEQKNQSVNLDNTLCRCNQSCFHTEKRLCLNETHKNCPQLEQAMHELTKVGNSSNNQVIDRIADIIGNIYINHHNSENNETLDTEMASIHKNLASN